MSINPNSDDEIYEINTLEDSIGTVIKLTRNEASKQPVTGEKVSETTEETVETKDQPSTSISTTDDRVLVPDVISQAMADDYMKEEELEEEDSDAETISSTSTADYDREEAEDLLDKISPCHTALATHYNKMNEVIPHMTKTQMAQYLGKVHILNIVKMEGTVSKTYSSEPATSETKFLVRGETHKERLQGLVDTVPAHQLTLCLLCHFFFHSRSQHYAYIYASTFQSLPNIVHIFMLYHHMMTYIIIKMADNHMEVPPSDDENEDESESGLLEIVNEHNEVLGVVLSNNNIPYENQVREENMFSSSESESDNPNYFVESSDSDDEEEENIRQIRVPLKNYSRDTEHPDDF